MVIQHTEIDILVSILHTKQTMHFPIFTAATLALTSAVSSTPIDPRQATTLNAAMKARGRSYIGTALTIRNDNTEQGIIRSEFGSVTPENAYV